MRSATLRIQSHSPHTGLRAGGPAAALALCLLLPFLHKAFTVDDVTFLLQAKHVLVDPLHPTAFDMVFDGKRIRVSDQLVTGPVMGYLLVPSVLLGGAEWVAHGIQAALLAISTIATASLALRLGLSRGQATIAAGLLVASPAVLGMAGTAMPDVAAMTFAVLGMERFVAWCQNRSWLTGTTAALFFALGALARPHVVLVLPCAALWVLHEKRWSRNPRPCQDFQLRPSMAPLLLSSVIIAVVIVLSRDPASGASVASATIRRIDVDRLTFNLASFASHWVVAFPFGLLWPFLRGRRFLNIRRTGAAFAVGFALSLTGVIYWPSDVRWWVVTLLWVGHGLDVLADAIYDAWERRDQTQIVLVLWMLIGAVGAAYVQLPAKVLVVSAPAMAILLARQSRLEERRPRDLKLVGVVIVLGLIVGILVLRADSALAEVGRRGGRVVANHVNRRHTVWMDGAWGFQWYAMQAGASVLADTPPFPKAGDLVVSGLQSRLIQASSIDKTLLYREVFTGSGGRVHREGAGFFSNNFGMSPWAWGHDELGRIEVWRINSFGRPSK